MRSLVHLLRTQSLGAAALFVALGGTGYAAITIPKNSVGTAQLRNHSITPVKFNNAQINGSIRAWAIIGSGGNVIASGGRPKVTTNSSIPGDYSIDWGVTLPNNCATLGNIDFRTGKPTETITLPGGTAQNVVAGYVSQVHTQKYVSGSHGQPTTSATGLVTMNQTGQPTPLAFDVAVIC